MLVITINVFTEDRKKIIKVFIRIPIFRTYSVGSDKFDLPPITIPMLKLEFVFN